MERPILFTTPMVRRIQHTQVLVCYRLAEGVVAPGAWEID
jgi:hypothetical protein